MVQNDSYFFYAHGFFSRGIWKGHIRVICYIMSEASAYKMKPQLEAGIINKFLQSQVWWLTLGFVCDLRRVSWPEYLHVASPSSSLCFLTTWWPNSKRQHSEKTRWKPYHTFWPLGTYFQKSQDFPNSKKRNRDPVSWWSTCNNHIRRKALGIGNTVVAVIG